MKSLQKRMRKFPSRILLRPSKMKRAVKKLQLRPLKVEKKQRKAKLQPLKEKKLKVKKQTSVTLTHTVRTAVAAAAMVVAMAGEGIAGSVMKLSRHTICLSEKMMQLRIIHITLE